MIQDFNIDLSKITDSARVSVTWDSYGIAVNLNYSFDEELGYGESVLCYAEPYLEGSPDETAWEEALEVGQLLKDNYNLPLDISNDDLFLHPQNTSLDSYIQSASKQAGSSLSAHDKQKDHDLEL